MKIGPVPSPKKDDRRGELPEVQTKQHVEKMEAMLLTEGIILCTRSCSLYFTLFNQSHNFGHSL